MKGILQEISAIQREVSRYPNGDSESVAVALRRSYPSDVEDLWEAITSPDRIKRWFALWTGPGWDGGLLALTLYLRGDGPGGSGGSAEHP